MIKLNLKTKNKEQEKIKEYLQENVSEILADKINNGVKITKESKTLIIKKDLTGFWNYATGEARKLTEKGSAGTYVDDETVYGWAIHYFEEDSIEGKLYNEDGTEYKPVVKTVSKPTPKVEPKKENTQTSLFETLLKENTCENNCLEQDDDFTEEEKQEVIEQENLENIPSYYTIYKDKQDTHPNSIILTRVGDFYEAFNNSADTIANELKLILTNRQIGNENIKMAGFPIHIKDKYINQLKSKHSILIINQDELEFIELENKDIAQPQNKYFIQNLYEILDGKMVLK